MFCPRCGKELVDGVRFCNNCGTPLTGELADDGGEFVKVKNQNRKIGIIVVAAIAVVVIALIVLIVNLLGGKSYEKPLDYLFHGIQKADAGEVVKAFPEGIWESSYTKLSKDEMVEALQERLDDLLDGTKVKISYEILDAEEYTQRQLRSLTKGMQNFGMEIEEIDAAYRLNIQMSMESDDEDVVDINDLQGFLNSYSSVRKGSFKEEVTVGKVDGKWYLISGMMMPRG